ncbi:MAG: hypothetical protein LBI34_00865 [Puniceicoccales bacterium]|jgi:hypothetical protein|nr:hypothetical protein [Puniceicoccales bacterium]
MDMDAGARKMGFAVTADERWEQDMLTRSSRDNMACNRGLALLRAMSPIDQKKIINSILSAHGVRRFLMLSKLIGGMPESNLIPACIRYKNTLNVSSTILLGCNNW